MCPKLTRFAGKIGFPVKWNLNQILIVGAIVGSDYGKPSSELKQIATIARSNAGGNFGIVSFSFLTDIQQVDFWRKKSYSTKLLADNYTK